MRDQQDLISRQMAATRSSLCEKIETLEQRVVDTVTGARDAVTETVGTVTESVQGTVKAVKGTVQDTVETVRGALDIKSHVERHPCISMGAATGVGFLLGRLLDGGRNRPRMDQQFRAEWPNGLAYAPAARAPVDAETAGRREESRANWLNDLARQFEPELQQLKAAAIGTGIGILRDLLMPSVPEQYRPTLTEVTNSVTSKLGGEPFRPGVFSREPERQATYANSHAGC